MVFLEDLTVTVQERLPFVKEDSSERESLDDDDVERTAGLYIFNHEVAQS